MVKFGKAIGYTWLYYNKRLVPMKAAGLAFYFLLSLIPFLFITIAIIGLVFAQRPEALDNLGTTMLGLLPPGLGVQTLTQVHGAVGNWETFGAVGVISLFFVAMGMFEALDWSINESMGTKKKIGFLHGRLLALAYIVGAILFFTLATVADYVFHLMLATPALAELNEALNIPRRVFSMIAFAVFLSLAYITFPVKPPKTTRAIFVAMIIAALWGLLQKLGAIITVYITRRHAVYGALAGGALFLTWMYLLAMLILVGSTILSLWNPSTREYDPEETNRGWLADDTDPPA